CRQTSSKRDWSSDVCSSELRDGQQQQIPADQVRAGEIVLEKNGAKVPVDGKVVAGTGAIDEASITGESMPVTKTASDQVFAGTKIGRASCRDSAEGAAGAGP